MWLAQTAQSTSKPQRKVERLRTVLPTASSRALHLQVLLVHEILRTWWEPQAAIVGLLSGGKRTI